MLNRAGHGIHEIELPLNHRLPGRCQAVFEISHVTLHRGIQRINHHLALDRPGDFNTTIPEIGWNAADRPEPVANMLRIRQKVRCHPPIKQGLLGSSGRQTGLQRGPKLTNQSAGERNGLLRKNTLETDFEGSKNVGVANRRDQFRHVVVSDLRADWGFAARLNTTVRAAATSRAL